MDALPPPAPPPRLFAGALLLGVALALAGAVAWAAAYAGLALLGAGLNAPPIACEGRPDPDPGEYQGPGENGACPGRAAGAGERPAP
jgi:hypothetical protein